MPEVFANMTAELAAVGETLYQTNYLEPNTPACLTYAEGKDYYRGFIGPLCFAKSPLPPTPPPVPPRSFALRRGSDCLVADGQSVVAAPCTSRASEKVWVEDRNENGWLALGWPAPRFLKVDEHPAPNLTTKVGFCTRGHVYLSPDESGTAHAQGYSFNDSSGQLQSSYCVGFGCLDVPADGSAAHTAWCKEVAGGWEQVY